MIKSNMFLFRLLCGCLIGATVFSCQKGLELSEGEEPEPRGRTSSPNEGFYFKAEIDGDSLIYEDLINSTITNGATSQYLNTDHCKKPGYGVSKAESFYFGDISDTGMVKIIEVVFWGCVPPQVNRDSLIEAREYNYGSLVDTIPGVIVSYIDQDEKEWRSLTKNGRLPSGQHENSFLITDLVNNNDSYAGRRAAGEFTVTLYDTLGGQIEIKDAEFVTRIRATH